MKMFIRGFVFTVLSIHAALFVIPSLKFADEKAFVLVVVGVALLSIFLKPLISMVSLPSSGPIFWFLSVVMNIIVLNVLALIVPGFGIQAAATHDLLIFSFMLPSKSLSAMLAGCTSALVLVLVYGFLSWLCVNGKKK